MDLSRNISAIAIMHGLIYGENDVVIETNGECEFLKNALIGQVKEDQTAFQNYGMSAVINYAQSALLDEETLDMCSISLNKHLSYIPGLKDEERGMYPKEEIDSMIAFSIKKIKNYGHNVFLQLPSKRTASVSPLLDLSDVIAVCLPQNIHLIHEFFEKEEYKLIHKRIVYFIENYDPQSKYSKTNLIRATKRLKRENVATVPYYTPYYDAWISGTTIDFFERNYECSPSDENYDFIQSIKHCVHLLSLDESDRSVV